MKIIRALVIGLVGVVTFVGCAWLGAVIAVELSHAHDIAVLGPLLEGGLIGSLVGVIAAFPVAKFFADYVWAAEKKTGDSAPSEIQQQLLKERELHNPDLERQRVEKYGLKIVICSSCGTKNSLSFQYCIKCSMDLSQGQLVDNPYL